MVMPFVPAVRRVRGPAGPPSSPKLVLLLICISCGRCKIDPQVDICGFRRHHQRPSIEGDTSWPFCGPLLLLGAVLPRPDPRGGSCHSSSSLPRRPACPHPAPPELPAPPSYPSAGTARAAGPRGRNSHRRPLSGTVGSRPEHCWADLLAPADNSTHHDSFVSTMRSPRPWREP